VSWEMLQSLKLVTAPEKRAKDTAIEKVKRAAKEKIQPQKKLGRPKKNNVDIIRKKK